MANRQPKPPTFEGGETRQGEIILKSKRQRLIFAGGLVALVVIALLAALLW